ncbi:hypothetical protein B0H17DRAFT_383051 [Mycena rosella]|uniref:Uncharacterized protein n=1 Tax=Mycena rosella TaxID=1033263 RepID=A0AAD7DS24_MYCRO|nr:hypothetical protein B0H17DRAFT_383051 [Mycena rosella]
MRHVPFLSPSPSPSPSRPRFPVHSVLRPLPLLPWPSTSSSPLPRLHLPASCFSSSSSYPSSCLLHPATNHPTQELEATLHCLRPVHEALDPDAPAPALVRVFALAVWERLPASHLTSGGAHSNGTTSGGGGEGEEGTRRMRRTALGLVETYASYFTTRAADAVLPPLRYVLGALADADRGVCLQVRVLWLLVIGHWLFGLVLGVPLYAVQRRGAGVRVSWALGTDGGRRRRGRRRVRPPLWASRRGGADAEVGLRGRRKPGREGLLPDIGCWTWTFWVAHLGLNADTVRVLDAEA